MSLATVVRVPGRGELVLNGEAAPVGAKVRGRVAFAAAHVVPAADGIDWERTLAFRHHLWSHGFGVAEAMDTAQRGMGLSWPAARELITRSAAEADGPIAAGAGTDQLSDGGSLSDVAEAYAEQVAFVEDCGAQPIVMASRHLAQAARSADDYREVYDRVLGGARGPVILHWLGEMFDPSLAGYWGADEPDEVVLDIIARNAAKVDGIKISLLDEAREVAIRRRLPAGVRLYTGDDFNFDVLIRGDEVGYSDALLGIFDPIAPVAAAALSALADGDGERYDELMGATVPLARKLFEAPTSRYKTGVVFLAWLNGHQPEFCMLGGMETARSREHLAEVLELADAARVLVDPELAADRARRYFAA